jgi:hypothetical protein
VHALRGDCQIDGAVKDVHITQLSLEPQDASGAGALAQVTLPIPILQPQSGPK